MSHTLYGEVVDSLQVALGKHLLAAYTFPTSGVSYAEGTPAHEQLVLILQALDDLHELRAAIPSLLPVDLARNQLQPIIATEKAFRRYLATDPVFAAHFTATARRLAGGSIAQTAVAATDVVTVTAFFAHEAFTASSALVPERVPTEEATAATRRLRRLATALTGREPPAELSSAALFAAVQMGLVRRLPEDAKAPTAADAALAVYRLRERHVVIIPETAPRKLVPVAWATLLERFGIRSTALHVATAKQMRAAISHWNPVDFALSNLEHRFGSDPLQGVPFSVRVLARAVARRNSQQLVHLLPTDYIRAADDEALHGVVHDYQNKLLNVRLQHELLRRVADVAVDPPEDALPGPDAPLAQRVEAILATLDQWAERYVALAVSQPPSALPAS